MDLGGRRLREGASPIEPDLTITLTSREWGLILHASPEAAQALMKAKVAEARQQPPDSGRCDCGETKFMNPSIQLDIGNDRTRHRRHDQCWTEVDGATVKLETNSHLPEGMTHG